MANSPSGFAENKTDRDERGRAAAAPRFSLADESPSFKIRDFLLAKKRTIVL
jgi:hypothetical protein